MRQRLQYTKLKVLTSSGFLAVGCLPLLVLMVCLAATFGYWRYLTQQSDNEFKNYFDFRVRQAVSLTEQRMRAQEQVLRGARGLFLASASVNRKQFHDYVSSLKLEENYPGIQGVGFSLIVPHAEFTQHIDMIRKDSGQADYTPHPAGERDLYTSIIYLEPFFGRNLRAFGFDMYSEPVRRAAMEKSRDAGLASLSGKVLLVQETGKNVQAGFLIYLPVYKSGMPHGTVQERRTNILGWVYSPFRMHDLALGMYGERSADLDIEIYDGDAPSSDTLMFDSDTNHRFKEASMVHVQPLKVVDHNWTLTLNATPALAGGFSRNQTNLVAFSGVGLSVLLALMAWILVNGRRRAEAYAKEVTQHLKQENQKNLAFLRNASDGIHILDIHGNIVEVSDSFCVMLGYSRDEMLNTNISQWDAGLVGADLTRKLELEFASQERSQFETRHRRKDGSLLDVEITGMPFKVDGETLLFNSARDVTDRNQSEAKLKRGIAALKLKDSALNAAANGIVITDVTGRIEWANQAFSQITGFSLEEACEHNPRDLLKSGQQDDAYYKILWDTTLAKKTWRGELINKRKDGSLYNEEMSITPILNEQNDITHFVAVKQDITERKQEQEQLSELNRNFVAFLENASDFIYFKDVDSRILFCSRTMANITGHSSWRDMIGKHDFEIFPEDTAKIYFEEELPIYRDGKPMLNKEDPYYDASGKKGWVSTSKWPLLNQDKTVVGLFGISRDITEHKLMEEKIQQLAFYDPLTNLPNRRLLNDRLSQIMAASRRSGLYGALMFLDLDNFKPLNDTHGHNIGDLLLIEVAARLKNCVRGMDSVARFGGDEFVVLLSELDSNQNESNVQARHLAEKILTALSEAYHLSVDSEGETVTVIHHCTVSIGVEVFIDHQASQDDILKWADRAMYQAKDAGRNQIRFYMENS